jgi:NADPH2:quinone reductase
VRAARLHELGGTPLVEDVDAPAADLVLDVTSSALNPVDVSIANGRFHGGTPEFPYTVGTEAVGRTADGRRLWYYGRGTMAEHAAVADPSRAVEVPEGVDDALALACGTAGVTGWLAVSWRAPVRPDDTVLVLGASGTLGGVAVEGARLLGARRVIGAARRVDAVPDAADEKVPLDGTAELPAATLIVDGLWGEPAERALAAAAPGVRVVQLGQSAGATATLQSAWVRGKIANVIGHSLGLVPPDVLAAGYRALCRHARDGRIRFAVETYDLDRVAEAWARQSTGSPGAKIVVTVA